MLLLLKTEKYLPMLGGERGGLKGREYFVSILYVATTLCPYDMSPHVFFPVPSQSVTDF